MAFRRLSVALGQFFTVGSNNSLAPEKSSDDLIDYEKDYYHHEDQSENAVCIIETLRQQKQRRKSSAQNKKDASATSFTENDPANKQQIHAEKLICLFDESPYYILKSAAQGNLAEVKRLYQEDENRLFVTDYRGQNIVHHASTWSRLDVLEFIASLIETDKTNTIVNNLVNGQDKLANTPLHHAIEKSQMPAIHWLLNNGANLQLKNIRNQMPIHFAIDLERVPIVKMLIEKYPWMVNSPGDLGSTPLHYACVKDTPQIAAILLDNGADLARRNNPGCPAIQAAARYGSSNVIETLMEYAEKQGISCKSLIHMTDKDNSFPLHVAVTSGDVKAVKACMKAGAEVDMQHQETRETAVHNAAAQGAIGLLSLMFETQPEKKESCLHCRDILEQTPLHKAAMFNYVDVCELLIDEGASINAQDGEKMTPLLLAAAKDASDVVNLLLKRRANISIRDKDNRNFLHLAVINGSRIRQINLSLVKNLLQLLNERDDFGCCPIHYASKTGQLGSLRNLMQFGANLSMKDNSKKNPLHIAARYGRFQTCANLLDDENGILLINEFDSDGRTPLAIAAMYGQIKVIGLLIRKGAILASDLQMNTPLHLAAQNGQCEAVVVLLGVAPHLLNALNINQSTPLHLAAAGGHSAVVDYLMSAGAIFEHNAEGASFFDLAITKFQCEVCSTILSHPRFEEAMKLKSIYGTPFLGLIQNLPTVALIVMDKCITYSSGDRKSEDFYIHYDFRYLQTPCYIMKYRKGSPPTQPMNVMVKFNRLNCLSHPLCVEFLKRKWNSFGSLVYNVRFFVFAFYLALLTSVAMEIHDLIQIVPIIDPTLAPETNNTNLTKATDFSNDVVEIGTLSLEKGTASVRIQCESMSSNLKARVYIAALLCLFNVAWQVISVVYQKIPYLFSISNWIEWAFYLSSIILMAPFFMQLQLNPRVHLIFAAATMFLGWVHIFAQLRYRNVGMYIVMFGHTFKTLLQSNIVFSFILVGFALVFKMIFRTTEGPLTMFRTPFVSYMSVWTMMTGEINYVDVISPALRGDRFYVYGNLVYFGFLFFMLVIVTMLKNLLLGLAVGDIEKVRKNARLEKLSSQVEIFTLMETRLPWRFMHRRMPREYTCYPNKYGRNVCDNFQKIFREDGIIGSLSEVANDLTGKSFALNEIERDVVDVAYVMEELTKRSRQIDKLMAKADAQHDYIKSIMQRVDSSASRQCSDGHDEREGEDGDDIDEMDDDGGDTVSINSTTDRFTERYHSIKRRSSMEYHSSGSVAHWASIASRISMLKKPKTSRTNVWRLSSKPINLISSNNNADTVGGASRRSSDAFFNSLRQRGSIASSGSISPSGPSIVVESSD